MSKKDTIEIKKGNLISRYYTLFNYLPRLIEKFSEKADIDFAKYEFGKFNGEMIYLRAINGKMCMTLKDFARYINMNFPSVQRAFHRIKKRRFSGDLIFEEDIQYFKLKRNKISGGNDKLSFPQERTERLPIEEIFLTFSGVWRLLPRFKSEVPIQFYYWWGDFVSKKMNSLQIEKGETLMLTDREVIKQKIGISKVDCNGFLYSSRGEMILSSKLLEIGAKIQYNAPIQFNKEEVKKMIPSDILRGLGYLPAYVTADFFIRDFPKTVIEYWGFGPEENPKYNSNRKWKEWLYSYLGIRLISIEATEVDNKPLLEARLRKELDL